MVKYSTLKLILYKQGFQFSCTAGNFIDIYRKKSRSIRVFVHGNKAKVIGNKFNYKF